MDLPIVKKTWHEFLSFIEDRPTVRCAGTALRTVPTNHVRTAHIDAVWLRGWPRPSLSCVTVNNFRTTGSIHLKNSQNPKWLLVNCSQLLWTQVMSGQWPTTIVIPAFAGVSGYKPLAGRDAKIPQPITPEPLVAAIRARRRSKALKETLLMNALKQFSEVVLKFKVRSNVKKAFLVFLPHRPSYP